MVEERTKEMDDRRRRELNIVVFNLPESIGESGADKKINDEETIEHIAAKLDIPSLDIDTSYRLGENPDDAQAKPRPLKVVLKDRKQRKKLLQNANKIKEILNENQKKVVIVKDLTIEQRKARKDKLKPKPVNNQPNQEGACGTNQDMENGNQPNLINEIMPRSVFDEETISMDQTVIGGIDHSQPSRGYATPRQCERVVF